VQVLANLSRNAIDALTDRPSERRVVVRCALVDGHAVAEVRDNGPGIAPESLAHLFDPFHTTKSSGTGLGLSIARGIVESHGGRIVVDSAAGMGSVFRVELPLADAGDVRPAEAVEQPSGSASKRGRAG
jgi:signal transduction histidine kinase